MTKFIRLSQSKNFACISVATAVHLDLCDYLAIIYSETPKPGPRKIEPKNSRTSKLSDFCKKLNTITCDIYYRIHKVPNFWSN